jgi:hypothetical protein
MQKKKQSRKLSRSHSKSRSQSKSKSKSKSRSQSKSLSLARAQGPKNLARSALFPRKAMMPGLIHVSGPSGSGKTTLMGMLRNDNLVIMDTDAVTDPIWREA